MIIDIILIAIAFIGILIGSITDIQKREVADWLNFSLIASGVGLRLLHSTVTGEWMFLIWGLIGLAIAFGIANLMFYTGQWGGGDAKMIMGLGALFGTYTLPIANGTPFSFLNPNTPLVFFGLFFIYSMATGAVFGLFYSVYKAIQNKKHFAREWKKQIKTKTFIYMRYAILAMIVLLIIATFMTPDPSLKATSMSLAALLLFGLYAMIFVRTVERGCMIDHVLPKDLVEGDWIVKDIKIDGKHIVGPKDLGIHEIQITRLCEAYDLGKIKKIAVKVGMPLVPAFLVGLIITMTIGNLFFAMIL